MNKVISVLERFQETFTILNGLPFYITLEQKSLNEEMVRSFEENIKVFIRVSDKEGLKKINVTLIKESKYYQELFEILVNNGFTHYSSTVEYERNLENLDLENEESFYEQKTVADQCLSEHQYKEIWKECMLQAENSPGSMTMEEHMNSVKSELGEEWAKSCIAFFKESKVIGITMPHIEPGTKSEGRLFYFGLVPSARGKGISKILHAKSLLILRDMGATCYIGSTNVNNNKMKKIFEKNGCTLKRNKESYRRE